MTTVIFACVHNAGRSQMAAAFFNFFCRHRVARAVSAGTSPARHVHPEVLQTMREWGLDLSSAQPQLLTEELARSASLLVTMGCGENCPWVPGLEVVDWPLADPKGQSIERVREIRDDIRRRVQRLLADRGWQASKSESAFDLQPAMEGEWMRLRPLEADDFEELSARAADPLIWEQHPQSNRYEREVFRRFFDEGMASRGALVVIDRASARIIGSSRYYKLDLSQRSVTIGYTFLSREYWGGPFNRELKTLMLRHAFRYVDFARFEIGPQNWRSRRAIEKIGARLLPHEGPVDGAHVIYQIAAEDF